jgi:hypothetical protein
MSRRDIAYWLETKKITPERAVEEFSKLGISVAEVIEEFDYVFPKSGYGSEWNAAKTKRFMESFVSGMKKYYRWTPDKAVKDILAAYPDAKYVEDPIPLYSILAAGFKLKLNQMLLECWDYVGAADPVFVASMTKSPLGVSAKDYIKAVAKEEALDMEDLIEVAVVDAHLHDAVGRGWSGRPAEEEANIDLIAYEYDMDYEEIEEMVQEIRDSR